ncbi:MAG TPA: hypothetical protein PK671_18145, partial [Candidatus Obscuribacter sp.]|nr:hypothetical protein [Candidatus Obscuribacter sp.]
LHLKLGMPDATLTRRLGRLVSILPTVETMKDRVEYIDLGLDNSIPLKVSKKPLKQLNGRGEETKVLPDGQGGTAAAAVEPQVQTANAGQAL